MSRVEGKAYYVYVLWSEQASRFYIGISEDPEARLKQHNEAQKGWTARYGPWVMVHTERHDSYRGAREREIELKSQKSGRGFYMKAGLSPKMFGRSLGS